MTADGAELTATMDGAQPRKGFSWWRALFSVGLLAAVCSTVNWSEETALLRHIAWGWVAAAILLHVINRLLSVVKWQVLLRARGFSHPYGELLGIIWVSNFFGHFLPGAVGGDSLRMWQVARRNARAPEAISTVFVERLTGAMSLAGLAVLGGVWGFARWGEHVIILALLIPLGVLLAALILLWTPWGERTLAWGLSHFRRVPGHQFFMKAVEAVHGFRHHPGPILASLALGLIVQFNRVAAVLCLAQAAGISLYIGEAFVVVPSALFIAMLPLTVGGLGLHEGAFVVLLGFVGVSEPAAFALALLSRFATLSSNLPGGVLFLLEGFERRREGRAVAPPDGSRPLRVLWLADKLGYGDRLHGLGHYYLNVIPSMRTVEVIPGVLRNVNGATKEFAEHGLRLRALGGALYDPRVFLRLRRVIRTEHIDAIQVHGYRSTALGRAVGLTARIPVIVRQGDSVPVAPIARWCDRVFAALTSEAIAVSDPVRRFCVEHRGIPAGRITTLTNAVPPRAGGRRSIPLRLPAGARLVGSITRFHPVKGVRYLVEAMADVVRAVPQAHLVLWGDGPERESLEARARELGIAAQVHFPGYQSDAASYLDALDCFVLPSLSEGSPNALLEALAAHRPVVATRVGGVVELVRDGEEALLVPPQDAAALAAAIIRILRNEELARRFSHGAEGASRRFSMSEHVNALERLYERVVRERRSSVRISSPDDMRRLSYRLWRSLRKLRPDVQGLCFRRYPEFVFRGDPRTLTGHAPVFTFHSVNPAAFEEQLRYLRDNGYETMRNADELVACLQGRQPLRRNSILLTFDDGRASLYRVAYPLLRRYGYQAVGFIVPTFVGKRNFCSWQELREMAASGIVDVQSHTLCHRFAPRWPLVVRCLNGTEETPEEARRYVTMEEDYRRSRELIEERVRRPVRHLCYPDYQGTDASVAASLAAGYVSNFWGVVAGRRVNRPGDDPYRVVRVPDVYLRSLPGKGRRSLARVLVRTLRCGGEGLSQWFADPSGQRFERDGQPA